MFGSYPGSTNTYVSCIASPGLVSAIPFGDLSTLYEPCLQFLLFGESATVAWWRYLELISTANIIAWLTPAAMEQLRVRQRTVGVYDVQTLGIWVPEKCETEQRTQIRLSVWFNHPLLFE